ADAEEITLIRTACASAVATDALARPDAARLGLFGCGAQAATHARAISRVRRLEQLLVWGRDFERATAFASRMGAELGIEARAVAQGREVARCADIICTVTSASSPIFLVEWVRDSANVNAVGSRYAGPVEIC